MESTTTGVWLAWVLGILPVLGLVLWWWNELCYVLPLQKPCSNSGTKLPPGHMGLPFFGELFVFLWYFKVVNRPDDFINSKRHKYGEDVGMNRSYLFGSPCIIAWSPSFDKFVYQSDDVFILEWPSVEILGRNSLVAVQGKAHARLRSCVMSAINRTQALRQIALLVQPNIIAALQSWADKPKIKAYNEVKKVTFENIGKYFVSFEPGPLLDTIGQLFVGMLIGVRANPVNFPGTAYHHALQCRKKLDAIFMEELEKKKNQNNGAEIMNDLMDSLMHIKDDEGNKLHDEEVLDNIINVLVAGYESTALSSMWAIYYLAKYPNVLKKLREENMVVGQKKKGDFITSDEVLKLEYTNKVVEEIIRMANVAAFTFRTATKDAEYEGYRIPKGWKVILWHRYLHTNTENFDDPLCFNPDRWNKPAKPGTFRAFGGGQRLCPGNMLARLQLAIFLHHLVVGYKWELLNPDARIVYLPHPKPADGVEILLRKI